MHTVVIKTLVLSPYAFKLLFVLELLCYVLQNDCLRLVPGLGEILLELVHHLLHVFTLLPLILHQ